MTLAKASALEGRAFSLLGFPQDGQIWYVRWLGALLKSETRSVIPMIRVHLERLDIKPELAINPRHAQEFLQRRKRPSQEYVRSVKVSAALLPALNIGRLYLDGTPIGSLRPPARTVGFDLSANKPKIMKAIDLKNPLPENWSTETPHRLINPGEFRVPASNGYCVLLTHQANGRCLEVVIPCVEVFRSLHARESKVVREMLAGPWTEVADRIANLELTGQVREDLLQVVLRKGMSEKFPEYVANLLLTEAGWQAANHVHGSIPMGAKSWHLKAPIPFDMQNFRLRGRMLVLREERNFQKLLCTEILDTSYPLTGKTVAFIRENDSGKLDKDGKESSARQSGMPYPALLEESELISSTSEEDPWLGGRSVFHSSEGSGWLDPVEKRKLEKVRSLEKKHNWKDDDSPQLRQTSAGNPSWRRSSSAPGQFRSETEHSEKLAQRFRDVLNLMEILLKQKKIDSWNFVKPSSSSLAAYQDGISLWKLPNSIPNTKGKSTYRPWAVVDAPTPRARTLIVLEIRAQGRRLLWFDIEPKGKGHRALILRLIDRPHSIEKIVNHVRAICVASRGTWHQSANGKGVTVPGTDNEIRWRHVHSGDSLSVDSVLQAFSEILGS